MWRYYRKSAVCYNYLVDVDSNYTSVFNNTTDYESTSDLDGTADSDDTSDLDNMEVSDNTEHSASIQGTTAPIPKQLTKLLKKQIKNSRWFTRGWTLQELIAPAVSNFYDVNWSYLGTADEDLLDIVLHRTGIPKAVIRASDTLLAYTLSDYSIAEKMSWAASRTTSREEDEAYCLLGLFGVYMPMLYGEGRKAFMRLQEEIIKTSTDHSIFASRLNVDTNDTGPLFAWGPESFFDSDCIQACNHDTPMESYHLNNRGLLISLPIVGEFKPHDISAWVQVDALLNCTWHTRLVTDRPKACILRLRRLSNPRDGSSLPPEYAVFDRILTEDLAHIDFQKAVKNTILIRRNHEWSI